MVAHLPIAIGQVIVHTEHSDVLAGEDTSHLERVARPLLELVQRITGLETSFITEIDWAAQRQNVVFALNTSELEVSEGASLDWSDSMCRWVFLSGTQQSSDVASDFPGSFGADKLGMQTFFALPILDGETTIGTVCGASQRAVELDKDQLEMMRLIGESLAQQVRIDIESRTQRDRHERSMSAANERIAALTTAGQAMEVLALTDALTGLANRRGFSARWEQELARSGRHNHPIALLLLDVDGFKNVNDIHGHEGGDRALQALSDVLRRTPRAEDVAARIGGDEFALVASYATAPGSAALAERIRRNFARATAALGIPCTVSIGVSMSAHTPRRHLMVAADKALYRGKRLGRDRVEVWVDASDGPAGGLSA